MAAGGGGYPRKARRQDTPDFYGEGNAIRTGRAGLPEGSQQFVEFLSRTGGIDRNDGLGVGSWAGRANAVKRAGREIRADKPALSAVEGSVRATRNTIERLPANPARLFPGTRCNGESKARLPGAWH